MSAETGRPAQYAAIRKDGTWMVVTPLREVAQHYANMACWEKHSQGFGVVENVYEVERGVYRRMEVQGV